MTCISSQPLKQRSRIDPCAERERLAADLPVTARVSEIYSLADNRARDLHHNIHIIFCNSHLFPLLLCLGQILRRRETSDLSSHRRSDFSRRAEVDDVIEPAFGYFLY